MPGFFSDYDFVENAIEQEYRKAEKKKGFINLTVSNPTHEGLIFPFEVLRNAAISYLSKRRYDPDPKGLYLARQAVSDYYKNRIPYIKIPTDNITITASTSESYGILFSLLADPGDNILAPKITYPLFEHLAAIHHIKLRPYELDENNNWQINENSILSEYDCRTRAIIIVSPHNPTGAVIKESVSVLNQLGLPVICDEVFAEFPCMTVNIPPFGSLHPDLTVFHLNGISKMFGLPDLKLGWIALSGPASKDFEKRLDLLNDTYLGANYMIQSMLPSIFSDGLAFVKQMQKHIRIGIDLAVELLSINPNISVTRPDGGYYLFPEIKNWKDEEKLVLYLLKSKNVLVHPGYFYDCDKKVHIMISCLTEINKLAEGIKRIIAAI
ncbi:MAG: pyridoxal phosphate-dependent aminotransferase [Pseudomonadota bacterium]